MINITVFRIIIHYY